MKLLLNIPINFTQLFFFILLCPLFGICALKSDSCIWRDHLWALHWFCGYLHSYTPDNGKFLQAPFLILVQFWLSSRVGIFFVQVILKVEILARFHYLKTNYISASSVSITWAELDRDSPGGTFRPTIVAAGNWGRDSDSQELAALPLNPLGQVNLLTHLSGLF